MDIKKNIYEELESNKNSPIFPILSSNNEEGDVDNLHFSNEEMWWDKGCEEPENNDNLDLDINEIPFEDWQIGDEVEAKEDWEHDNGDLELEEACSYEILEIDRSETDIKISNSLGKEAWYDRSEFSLWK